MMVRPLGPKLRITIHLPHNWDRPKFLFWRQRK
jgi:hypothetical protein